MASICRWRWRFSPRSSAWRWWRGRPDCKSSQQIQAHFTRLGVPMWGSRAEQVYQTVTKFSKPQLERAMELIYEADKGLRDARPDDRIVMERFVMELS